MLSIAMINAFYDRVEQDELLSPFFPGGCTKGIAGTWPPGGARSSEARRTTPSNWGATNGMLAKHRQLGITDEQRFRFASLMSHAADDAGMPNDPEFRSPWSPISNGERELRSREFTGRRQRDRARPGTAVGLGRGTAVSALIEASTCGDDDGPGFRTVVRRTTVSMDAASRVSGRWGWTEPSAKTLARRANSSSAAACASARTEATSKVSGRPSRTSARPSTHTSRTSRPTPRRRDGRRR